MNFRIQSKCTKIFEVPIRNILLMRYEPNKKNIPIEISQKSMAELMFTHFLARNYPPN